MALSESKRPWVKYFLAGWAFLECLLFAGILYGWGSLVFIFKSHGIYADLCDRRNENLTLSNMSNETAAPNHNHTAYMKQQLFEGHNNSNIVYSIIDGISYTHSWLGLDVSTNHISTKISNSTLVSSSQAIGSGLKETGARHASPCVAQDSRLALCFTVSSAIFCISCVVMGAVNYRLGTRATRLIAL